MIFTVENIVILLFTVGIATSGMCMILKHEWDLKSENSNYWIVRNFFNCELCTGLYLMMIQCVCLVPFFGLDVLILPFAGAGIVNYLIR